MVNDDSLISDIEHHCPLGKSDHEVLIFKLYIGSRLQQKCGHALCFARGRYDQMRAALHLHDWSDCWDMEVEALWSKIKQIVSGLMQKFIPLTKRNKNSTGAPWMTKGLLRLIKSKYRLYKCYTSTKLQHDFREYVTVRNKCTSEVRRVRVNFERKLSKDVKKNPKRYWNYVRRKSVTPSGVGLLKVGGRNLVSDFDKANAMNEFFGSVFTEENTATLPDVESQIIGPELRNILITPESVRCKLRKLDITKSCGPDGIPPRVWRELAEDLAVPLSVLYNLSIHTGVVPLEWRRAVVVALHKKGSRTDPGNYRPVSLTCISCKVLEMFFRDAIVEHMDRNHSLVGCQHGFRRRRSCVSQLLHVLDDFTRYIDEKQPFDVFYLDIKKAFDTVPHRRLLAKIWSYGVRGNVLRWIESFLSEFNVLRWAMLFQKRWMFAVVYHREVFWDLCCSPFSSMTCLSMFLVVVKFLRMIPRCMAQSAGAICCSRT